MVITFFVKNSVAQEETSRLNPSAFADFLYNSELYDFASEEYERLIFDEPGNLVYLKRLLKCYQKTGNDDRLMPFDKMKEIDDKETLQEFYDLLLLTNNISYMDMMMAEKSSLFSMEESMDHAFKSAIARRDWNGLSELKIPHTDTKKYDPLFDKIENTRFKKPATAAIMSAIIPGAGRVYAKDTKDGLISLFIVGSTAYQSYRRFNQKGIKSVSGWIFGGISLGFYISNIYGSYQSAKYYNKKLDDKIYQFALPTLLYNSN